MNNTTTMEQLKTEAEKIINSQDFQKAINKTIENKMFYYEWLKEYLHCENLHPMFKSEEDAFNYLIEYIYHCMIMDKHKSVEKVTTSSVVYFIRNEYNGLLKIGKTNNLQKRIDELKGYFNLLGLECNRLSVEAISYCPFGINNGKVETYYHKMFADKRKIGEWFDIDYDTILNSLNVDYIINGTLVTVEDSGDFPYGLKKIKLDESNINSLKDKVKNDLSDKIYSNFYIHKDVWDSIVNKQNIEISSKNIYDYVMTLKSKEDTKLDIKIENKLKEILNFVCNG